MQNPRILVAGAGYLGMAFADLLKGSELTLARRSPAETKGFSLFRCDFSDARTLSTLPDFDLVYYAVAADSGSDDAYEKAYLSGLKNLVDHFKARGLRPAFFYSSSTSVYAASEGEICAEDAPLVTSGGSRFMVAGEKYLLDSGLKATVVRYGGIYGPDRTSFLRRVRDGREPLTAGFISYMNRIHRDDAAAIIRFLFEKGESGVFNAVDLSPTIRDEVILWVAERLGVSVPQGETKLARGHRRVISDKLQKLGYRFTAPSYREGYEPLLKNLES